MALVDFLGQELTFGLARLDPSRLFGAWLGGNPSEARKRTGFSPILYREDHVHPHQEYCLLLSGRCRLSFQHRTAELMPGDLVVCTGGVHHAETICSTRVPYRMAWWILLQDKPMLHVRRYRHKGGYDVEHVVRLGSLSNYGERRLECMRQLAARAISERPSIEALREAMLSVTVEVYRQVLNDGENPVDARAELARKMTDFVKARSGGPLTLADVAKAVHMSPNYLTSLFHSQTGVPLGRFILSERVALAQRMLAMPKSSVKSVGLELGFSDPFTFSRAFKRVTGLAPRAWKRRQENGNGSSS